MFTASLRTLIQPVNLSKGCFPLMIFSSRSYKHKDILAEQIKYNNIETNN